MKNTQSLTKFVEHLGCHLKIGYHWSAISSDNQRLVVTIWDDQLDGDNYVLVPAGTAPWMELPGGVQLKKDVAAAFASQAEVLGVLCHAEDPSASRRVRAYYDEKALLVLNLEKRGEEIVAIVIGETDTADAAAGSRRISQRKSAANDLDEIPEGVQSPEKIKFEGVSYKRDRMVRDHVVRRANGKCEYCGADGFLMENGRRYIEAHHIIGLGKNGPDTIANVIGLCPSHHREAHFGINSIELNKAMQIKVDLFTKSITKQEDGKSSA